jgi:hypothetical protein
MFYALKFIILWGGYFLKKGRKFAIACAAIMGVVAFSLAVYAWFVSEAEGNGLADMTVGVPIIMDPNGKVPGDRESSGGTSGNFGPLEEVTPPDDPADMTNPAAFLPTPPADRKASQLFPGESVYVKTAAGTVSDAGKFTNTGNAKGIVGISFNNVVGALPGADASVAAQFPEDYITDANGNVYYTQKRLHEVYTFELIHADELGWNVFVPAIPLFPEEKYFLNYVEGAPKAPDNVLDLGVIKITATPELGGGYQGSEPRPFEATSQAIFSYRIVISHASKKAVELQMGNEIADAVPNDWYLQ